MDLGVKGNNGKDLYRWSTYPLHISPFLLFFFSYVVYPGVEAHFYTPCPEVLCFPIGVVRKLLRDGRWFGTPYQIDTRYRTIRHSYHGDGLKLLKEGYGECKISR